MLLVMLSLVSLRVLSHWVDLSLGGVQHDGKDLQIPQEPQFAETCTFTALPDQQLGHTWPLDVFMGLLHSMFLKK